MTAVILRLTLMSLIVGNSFNFTILVRISADTIRIVCERRLCADILSGGSPDTIRIVSGEHCLQGCMAGLVGTEIRDTRTKGRSKLI
jgi:hypothetical protein